MDLLTEEWRPVVGFEDSYEVSNIGRVRSLPRVRSTGSGFRTVRGRMLHPAAHLRGGYLYVTLHGPGRPQAHRKIHHLVCESFNGPRPFPDALTRHLDGDHLNNSPENLAWGTVSENLRDCVKHGTHHNASKTHCALGHLLAGENLYINATSGNRQCRTCQGRSKAAHAARKAADRARG